MTTPSLRPNPDELLARVQAEERQQARGRLKIFLGYAAGVGKTFAMLEAAQQRRAEGVDVVVGYIETHGRAETEAKLAGLEVRAAPAGGLPRRPRCPRWMWTPCWPAARSWRWWTSSPTPTRPARATPSATRT